MKSCFDKQQLKASEGLSTFQLFNLSTLLCACLATAAQGAFEGREIVRRADMCNVDTVDTVAWYAQESVRLEVEPWRCGRRVEIPQGATAAWVVCDEGGTNWIVRYDSAPASNRCAFALGAGEGNLPSGHDYTGYVSLLRGTNILGVLDRHEVAVMGQAADGGNELSPEGGCWGSLLQRMAEAEADIHGIAGDLATNALEIANLERATNSLDFRLLADENNISSLEWVSLVLQQNLSNNTERLDSLYAKCAGGFRWPDYFEMDAIRPGTSEGVAISEVTATNHEYNISYVTGYTRRYKGWELIPYVVRQTDFEAHVAWRDASAGTAALPLVYSNNYVLFPEGLDWDMLDSFDDEAMAGACNRYVTGRLGGYEREVLLEWSPKQRAEHLPIHRFAGAAPGSLLAACWSNVVGTASNAYAQGRDIDLRTWPEGKGSGANHVSAGWNTNFWATALGDFSCISYHTDTAPGVSGGQTKPVTMVTPKHGIVANHWKPTVGSNVYFVGRSGAILTNQVIAYQNVCGDLTIARMAEAMPTNEVVPASLLASGWHSYLYGATNCPGGIFGVPVIGFDVSEKGYLMNWSPIALMYGKQPRSSVDDKFFFVNIYNPFGFPYFRTRGVAGDSGSPIFWPVDGHLLLLGCYYTAIQGPIPTKEEIDAAIAAWGDEERTEEYDLQSGGWPNPDAPPPMN